MSKALIRIESQVNGTLGYSDPKYCRTEYLSEKSDVYTFGVVLLEVFCCRKPIVFDMNRNHPHLATWACQCIENGTIYHIIDPHLKGPQRA